MGIMVSNKLIKNVTLQLKDTLSCLSDAGRQQKYKDDVPFVHIPIELLEQWSNYVRMLNERDWYGQLFEENERQAMLDFDAVVSSFSEKYSDAMPDVEEVLDNVSWKGLMEKAGELLVLLGNRIDVLLVQYGTEQGN